SAPGREPDPELALSRLRRIRAVHEVLHDDGAPVAAKVAADRARRRERRLGRSRERAEALDDALPRDADRDDRTRFHEIEERLVERLALVLRVVLGEEDAVGLHEPDVDELVPLRLD